MLNIGVINESFYKENATAPFTLEKKITVMWAGRNTLITNRFYVLCFPLTSKRQSRYLTGKNPIR